MIHQLDTYRRKMRERTKSLVAFDSMGRSDGKEVMGWLVSLGVGSEVDSVAAGPPDLAKATLSNETRGLDNVSMGISTVWKNEKGKGGIIPVSIGFVRSIAND